MDMHLTRLVIGDWSHDGHEKTADFLVKTNLSMDALAQAYVAGCAKLGIKLHEFVEDYQAYEVPRSVIATLTGGVKAEEDLLTGDLLEQLDADPDALVGLSVDDYAILWLLVARAGRPELVWEEQHVDTPVINIGGYGLFE